jgi:hypothetical protein
LSENSNITEEDLDALLSDTGYFELDKKEVK